MFVRCVVQCVVCTGDVMFLFGNVVSCLCARGDFCHVCAVCLCNVIVLCL